MNIEMWIKLKPKNKLAVGFDNHCISIILLRYYRWLCSQSNFSILSRDSSDPSVKTTSKDTIKHLVTSWIDKQNRQKKAKRIPECRSWVANDKRDNRRKPTVKHRNGVAVDGRIRRVEFVTVLGRTALVLPTTEETPSHRSCATAWSRKVALKDVTEAPLMCQFFLNSKQKIKQILIKRVRFWSEIDCRTRMIDLFTVSGWGWHRTWSCFHHRWRPTLARRPALRQIRYCRRREYYPCRNSVPRRYHQWRGDHNGNERKMNRPAFPWCGCTLIHQNYQSLLRSRLAKILLTTEHRQT